MYHNRKWIFISIFLVSTLLLNILVYPTLAYPKESSEWTHSLSVKPSIDTNSKPFMVIGTAIDVQVIPFENQVIIGELLEVNVTVFDDGDAVGNARIKLTLKQLSTEFETTQFLKIQTGVYQASFNTTSLTIGKWSLIAEVKAGGDTHYGESSVTIISSPQRETSDNLMFLIIAVAGICIGAVGLVYVSAIELFGTRKKKKRKRK